MVERTLEAIFGTELLIDQTTLLSKLVSEQFFLLNPKDLRSEIASETQSLHY